MDYKIVFSEPSIEDLGNIVHYIATDNPQAASRFGAKLIASVRNLAVFPRLGRIVPEKNDDNVREIIFKPYRIFYRVNDDTKTVEIARFWHAARGEPPI